MQALVSHVVIAASLLLASGSTRAEADPPEERFASVNGVRPHYLDWGAKAAVDYKRSAELAAEAGFGPPDDPALAAILEGAGSRHPEFDHVKVPALSIAVVFDGPIPVRPEDDEAYKRFVKLAEQRDLVGARVRDFERRMAHGETRLLRNTTHGGFVTDEAQQKVFVPVMRELLLRR
jgi:hypothetical protein